MWGKDESAAIYGSYLYSYVIRHIQDNKLSVPTNRGMSVETLLKDFSCFQMNLVSFILAFSRVLSIINDGVTLVYFSCPFYQMDSKMHPFYTIKVYACFGILLLDQSINLGNGRVLIRYFIPFFIYFLQFASSFYFFHFEVLLIFLSGVTSR